MNHVANRHQKGFTIIEMMLAMAFVTALMLAIAFSIIQIGVIYNKGLTLKDINQTGREISDQLIRSVSASAAFDPATQFSSDPTLGSGRLCTGQVSFLWNFADGIVDGASGVITYSSTGEPVQLVRVADNGAAYCAKTGSVFTLQQVRAVDEAGALELLRAGDRSLSIHQASLLSTPNAIDATTGQRLYQMSFTIGSSDVTALSDDRTSCLPPGNINANFAYCAVQQFTLVLRAGNKVN